MAQARGFSEDVMKEFIYALAITLLLWPFMEPLFGWLILRPTREERRRRKAEQRRREADQMRLFIPPSTPIVRPHLTGAQCTWHNVVVPILIAFGGIGAYLWIAAHLYGR